MTILTKKEYAELLLQFEIRHLKTKVYLGCKYDIHGVFFKKTDERTDVPWNPEEGAVYDDCTFWIRCYGEKWIIDNYIVDNILLGIDSET